MRVPIATFAFAAALACGHETFACREDVDCSGRAEGACEPDGWCSFPDDACPSGRRYGHWAGDGRADTCVPADVADTGTAATSSSTTTGDGSGPASSSDATSSAATTAVIPETSGEGSSSAGASSSGEASESTTGDPAADRIAWYRFEEEAFAGIVLDDANGHHGVCEEGACPTPTLGVVGNAAAFDGVDDMVRVADHVDFATAQGFTLAAWALVEEQPGFRSIVAKPIGDLDDHDMWELGRDANGFVLANMVDGDGVQREAYTPRPVAAGTWVHLAGTWDGATLRVYVDGVEQSSSAAGSITISDHDLYFGASWDFGVADGFLLGALDELQIWRRALDEAELAALAAR